MIDEFENEVEEELLRRVACTRDLDADKHIHALPLHMYKYMIQVASFSQIYLNY